MAWLRYAICLGTVFLGVNSRLDINLPLTILCNVAPAVLLGLAVFQICEKLKWTTRQHFRFFIVHAVSLFLFTALWCFLDLHCLSVLSFVQRGEWFFVRNRAGGERRLPFGAALWLVADELAIPALGLSKPIVEYPLSSHGYALASHLVYGLTTDLTRRGVRRIL